MSEMKEKRVYKPASQKQAEQTAELRAEMAEARPSLRPPKWAAPLGAAVLVLAGVGVYFLISLVLSAMNKPQDNSHLFDQYTRQLSAVVMFDPPNFVSADRAEDKQPLLLAALQRCVDEAGDDPKLDEMGNMIIPADNIAGQLDVLFGEPGKKVMPTTLNIHDIKIEFNIIDQCYHVPVAGYLGSFAPKVEDIQIDGGEATVRVGYLEENEYETGTAVVKTKLYNMILREGREPYISSIADYTP